METGGGVKWPVPGNFSSIRSPLRRHFRKHFTRMERVEVSRGGARTQGCLKEVSRFSFILCVLDISRLDIS